MRNQIETIDKLISGLTQDYNLMIKYSGSTTSILLTNIENSISKLVEAKQLLKNINY